MSKEKTKEEVQDEFLSHIAGMVDYWENEAGSTTRLKLEGLAFSFLTTLDGCTNLPAFIVAPVPHPDDKQYAIDQNEDWYPQNDDDKVNCDIAGGLHEKINKYFK